MVCTHRSVVVPLFEFQLGLSGMELEIILVIITIRMTSGESALFIISLNALCSSIRKRNRPTCIADVISIANLYSMNVAAIVIIGM